MKKEIYTKFMLFFEGANDLIEASVPCSTYAMGVTKLDYNEEENVLHVHLRRPGLLIGKQGTTIDRLKKYLDCGVHIHEVVKLWD